MAITEIRASGDGRHIIVYTESPQVEEALRQLDCCIPLGTYYNSRGKFGQDFIVKNGLRGKLKRLLKKSGNPSKPRRGRNRQI